MCNQKCAFMQILDREILDPEYNNSPIAAFRSAVYSYAKEVIQEENMRMLQPAKPDPIDGYVDGILDLNHMLKERKIDIDEYISRLKNTITEAVKEGSRGK